MKNVRREKDPDQNIHAERTPTGANVLQDFKLVQPPYTGLELLPQRVHVRFTQYFFVIKLNFVDLHSALAALAPTHLGIIDVIKRLFRPLEQDHRSPEAAWGEIRRS